MSQPCLFVTRRSVTVSWRRCESARSCFLKISLDIASIDTTTPPLSPNFKCNIPCYFAASSAMDWWACVPSRWRWPINGHSGGAGGNFLQCQMMCKTNWDKNIIWEQNRVAKNLTLEPIPFSCFYTAQREEYLEESRRTNIVGTMDSNANTTNDRFKPSGDFSSWFRTLINTESTLESLKPDSVIVNCLTRRDRKLTNAPGNQASFETTPVSCSIVFSFTQYHWPSHTPTNTSPLRFDILSSF